MHLKDLIEENSKEGSQHDQLQRLVASDREKAAFELIAPEAREAVKAEIVPQLEDQATSVDALDGLIVDTKAQITHAFKTKNPTHTRLIRYKSIDQSDAQYETDLLAVMDEWAKRTRETLDDGKKPGDEDKQEVKVKVEIDGADTVETSTEVADNLSAKVPDTEDVAVTDAPPFDLGDVRV